METDLHAFPLFSVTVLLPAGREVEYSYAVLREGEDRSILHVQAEVRIPMPCLSYMCLDCLTCALTV